MAQTSVLLNNAKGGRRKISLIQPNFGVELVFFLAELEVEDSAIVVGGIAEDGTENLLGGYIIALLNIGLREVTIDGDVGAVANEDIEESVELEDSSHLAVEDGTSLGSGLTLNVYTLIVEGNIAQASYIVLSVTAYDDVGTRDG